MAKSLSDNTEDLSLAGVQLGQRTLQSVQSLVERLGTLLVGLIVALQQSELLTPGLSLAG